MNISYKAIKKRIRMELSPWGFSRNYVLLPIKLFFQKKCGLGNQDYKRLSYLKDKHVGKRCFIIATGPSLTVEDVLSLQNEITFGENTIFKLYPQVGDWRPTYFAMTDNGRTTQVLKDYDIQIDDLAKECCIFNALNKKEIRNSKKAIFVDTNWLDHCYHFGKSRKFKYNSDLSYCVYDVYSITQECILYAIYMGFKVIYVLGADNNFAGKQKHFLPSEEDSRTDYDRAILAQKANDMGYKYVNSIAQNRNVKIYNATRGGNIQEFERVCLDDVLSET